MISKLKKRVHLKKTLPFVSFQTQDMHAKQLNLEAKVSPLSA
jgi:hypothetical protein